MKTFILDASVGAKWIFEEEFSKNALTFKEQLLQNKIRVVVPEIFYCELANICAVKVRQKVFDISDAIEGLDEVLRYPLKRYPDDELADVALGYALQYGISAYDGLYLALAEIYAAPLVTADLSFFQMVQGRFDYIESLKDFN